MGNIAVVDAGPLIALFDNSDKYHCQVKQILEKYRCEDKGKLITTWPVITEVSYMLKEHVHLESQLDFLKWIVLGGTEIFNLTKENLSRIVELQKKYSNLSMDFADATIVVTAESLRTPKVFSIDKEFLIYRILGSKHFENLMR